MSTHRLDFKCENGHEQGLTYKDCFTREQVEMQGALMAGGHIAPLNRDVPGFPCGICGGKISHTVVDVDAEPIA